MSELYPWEKSEGREDPTICLITVLLLLQLMLESLKRFFKLMRVKMFLLQSEKLQSLNGKRQKRLMTLRKMTMSRKLPNLLSNPCIDNSGSIRVLETPNRIRRRKRLGEKQILHHLTQFLQHLLQSLLLSQ